MPKWSILMEKVLEGYIVPIDFRFCGSTNNESDIFFGNFMSTYLLNSTLYIGSIELSVFIERFIYTDETVWTRSFTMYVQFFESITKYISSYRSWFGARLKIMENMMPHDFQIGETFCNSGKISVRGRS